MISSDRQAPEKHALRSTMQRTLAAVGQHELVRIGQHVTRRLLALPAVRHARVLAAYAAMSEELSVDEVVTAKLHEGGTVVLPRYDAATQGYQMVAIRDFETDMVRGRFGIREPRPELPAEDPARLRSGDTAWLVPGLAFDLQGNRLGRGGGFYDRLLAGVVGPRIGVALERQIVSALPAEAHDATMTMVVSEHRVLHFPSAQEAPETRKENQCPQISSKPCLSPQISLRSRSPL